VNRCETDRRDLDGWPGDVVVDADTDATVGLGVI
jgi:hypothetical protein